MTEIDVIKKWFFNNLDDAGRVRVLKYLYGDVLVTRNLQEGLYCGPAPGMVKNGGLFCGPAPTALDVIQTNVCPNCGRPM